MKNTIAKALAILWGLCVFLFGIYNSLEAASSNLFGVVLSDIAGESYFKWIDNIPFLYATAIAVFIPVMLLSFFPGCAGYEV